MSPGPWLTVTVVLAGIALAGGALWSVWRDRGVAGAGRSSLLAALWLTAIVALSAWLLRPSERDDVASATGSSDQWSTVVLLDASRSMARPVGGEPVQTEPGRGEGDAGEASRWARAKAWLEAGGLLTEDANWVSSGRVPILLFGERLRAAPRSVLPAPADDQTRLFAALAEWAGRREGVAPGGAVVLLLLSDGGATDGPWDGSVVSALRSAGVRVHPVRVAEEAGSGVSAARRLTAWVDEPFLLRGETTTLRAATLAGDARLSPEPVELWHGGRLLATTRWPVELDGAARREGADRVVEATFALSPSELVQAVSGPGASSGGEAARVRYVVRWGEASEAVLVEVAPRPLRVLWIEGSPSWDSRFAAAALVRDGSMTVARLTALGPRRVEVTPGEASGEAVEGGMGGLLALRSSLQAYDVVVLGRGVERVLTPEQAGWLEPFVAEGGGLVLSRGQPAGPGPVREAVRRATGLRFEPIPAEEHAVSLEGAGASLGLEVAEAAEAAEAARPSAGAASAGASAGPGAGAGIRLESASGRTVASGGSRGAGRVAWAVGSGWWRGAMTGDDALRRSHDAFWSRLVRWSATGSTTPPGRGAVMRASALEASAGAAVEVEVAARPAWRSAGGAGRAEGLTLRWRPVVEGRGAGGAEEAERRAAEVEEVAGEAVLTMRAPGEWRGRVTIAEPGEYVLAAALMRSADGDGVGAVPDRLTVTRPLRIRPATRERVQAPASLETLSRLAEATGGRVLDAASPGDWREAIGMGPDAAAGPGRDATAPGWRRWPSEAALGLTAFGALALGWLLRRRWGLV